MKPITTKFIYFSRCFERIGSENKKIQTKR